MDVGLLIDTHRAGARLLQVEIGALEHESQSLSNLGLMAQATGRRDKLTELLAGAPTDSASREQAIAQLFRFVHKREFEAAANAVTLRPEIIDTVNWLRRFGYR